MNNPVTGLAILVAMFIGEAVARLRGRARAGRLDGHGDR